MNTVNHTNYAGHPASLVDSFVNIARNGLGAIDQALTQVADHGASWAQRIADRRTLQTLDDHVLHDIGLSRADIEREASKRFWQA
ncbi:MAG: DUF1127 domain-containing protein [Dongiaceae bacterium]